MRHQYKRRGHSWRVQDSGRGDFDEIVVVVGKEPRPRDDGRNGLILHAEMLDARSCFVDVAGLCLWVHVGRDGVARIRWTEDRRPDELRGTKVKP